MSYVILFETEVICFFIKNPGRNLIETHTVVAIIIIVLQWCWNLTFHTQICISVYCKVQIVWQNMFRVNFVFGTPVHLS